MDYYIWWLAGANEQLEHKWYENHYGDGYCNGMGELSVNVRIKFHTYNYDTVWGNGWGDICGDALGCGEGYEY